MNHLLPLLQTANTSRMDRSKVLSIGDSKVLSIAFGPLVVYLAYHFKQSLEYNGSRLKELAGSEALDLLVFIRIAINCLPYKRE